MRIFFLTGVAGVDFSFRPGDVTDWFPELEAARLIKSSAARLATDEEIQEWKRLQIKIRAAELKRSLYRDEVSKILRDYAAASARKNRETKDYTAHEAMKARRKKTSDITRQTIRARRKEIAKTRKTKTRTYFKRDLSLTPIRDPKVSTRPAEFKVPAMEAELEAAVGRLDAALHWIDRTGAPGFPRRRRRPPLSEDETKVIFQLYEQGDATIRQLADFHRVTPPTIYRIIKIKTETT